MRRLGTYRFVPPIGLHAMARAVVVFSVFLAARDTAPVLAGRVIDPIGLALALTLALIVLWNVTGGRGRRALVGASPRTLTIALAAVAGTIGALLFLSQTAAMLVWSGYYIAYAANTYVISHHMPDAVPQMNSVWAGESPQARKAVQLVPLEHLVVAATMIGLIQVGDPVLFAAFATFGVLVVHFFTNWLILLVVYDDYSNDLDDGY